MPDEHFDERKCLRQTAAGDEVAARRLLRQFHPFVLKLVRSHLPRRMSEEDLTQMIFIKILRNLDSYSGKVPLEHWISRIAINTCLNELRAEKRRPEWRLSDFDPETSAAIEQLNRTEPDLASPDDQQAAKQLLNTLLSQLSPDDRLLISLLHLEEKSVEEIHQLTGWSRTKVKVRAFRAREKMKKMLQRQKSLTATFSR
jgi:RNA polymerase sigma-70 factor (ECF subfamily)